MKKLLSLLCALTAFSVCFTAYDVKAEGSVPVDVDESVYEIFKSNWFDRDSDGIITADEVAQANSIRFNLDDVSDLSWMEMLKNCNFIEFEGGKADDFSVLSKLPKLRYMLMESVQTDDISFIKDLSLVQCVLEDMDNISLEQRLDVVKWEDYTIEQGYTKDIGIYPIGLFKDYSTEITLSENSGLHILRDRANNSGTVFETYASEPCSAEYTAKIDGKEVHTGKIEVTPLQYISPQLSENATNPKIYDSFYYGRYNVIVDNEILYGIKGDTYYKADENVKSFSRAYEKNQSGDYIYTDLVLKNDGTLILNEIPVENLKFKSIQKGSAIADDGTLYEIYPDGDNAVAVKVDENCAEVVYPGNYYLDSNGEIIWYDIKYSGSKPVAVKTATGMKNPEFIKYDLFLEGETLWKCKTYPSFSKTKVSDNVEWVGYELTDRGYMDYVYRTTDGKCYMLWDGKEVNIIPTAPVDNSELFHDDGTFYIHAYDSKYGDGADLLIRWIITNDDVLTINLAEQHFAISDVKEVIGAEYVEEQDKGYAWFIRNDGSIWRYCFETQESVRMSEESTQTIVSGDANGDGAFNISDAVTLQNWLLSVYDTELINWKAVDLNDDGEINVFDLCMMKRMLCDTQK